MKTTSLQVTHICSIMHVHHEHIQKRTIRPSHKRDFAYAHA